MKAKRIVNKNGVECIEIKFQLGTESCAKVVEWLESSEIESPNNLAKFALMEYVSKNPTLREDMAAFPKDEQ